jgi:ketosteroid isomerase-like protein
MTEFKMPANDPAEICQLFQRYMRQGDMESVLSLYDKEIVFINEAGQEISGIEALKEELAPFVSRKAVFDFSVKKIVQKGEIALMHTVWTISPQQISLYAIEIARRQADGTWRWLIGDPFTVGKHIAQP